MAGRGRAKSRDDITSLMHVVYCGEDSVPLQKDTELYVMSNLFPDNILSCASSVLLMCSMSAPDIWARKYHELWEKLEKNTKDSFCTALWKWIVSLVKNLCSLSDHAKPSHHCCLVPYKYCTHRHGATIRAMTQQYIQLSSVCCSLRTYWLKWLQRTPKIPLATSGLLGKHFPRFGVPFRQLHVPSLFAMCLPFDESSSVIMHDVLSAAESFSEVFRPPMERLSAKKH